MGNQRLLTEFKVYADNAIKKHEPTAYKRFKAGSIERAREFLLELKKKVESYNADITKQANVILKKGENDKEVDSVKLKADLIAEGKKAATKFVSTLKPK